MLPPDVDRVFSQLAEQLRTSDPQFGTIPLRFRLSSWFRRNRLRLGLAFTLGGPGVLMLLAVLGFADSGRTMGAALVFCTLSIFLGLSLVVTSSFDPFPNLKLPPGRGDRSDEDSSPGL